MTARSGASQPQAKLMNPGLLELPVWDVHFKSQSVVGQVDPTSMIVFGGKGMKHRRPLPSMMPCRCAQIFLVSGREPPVRGTTSSEMW